MRKIKVFLVLFLSVQFANAQLSLDNYALTGVTIIDANHKTPLPHQTVLISHQIIRDIFRDGSKLIDDSFSIIKAQGKYLIPGLIDAHVHLATDPSGVDNRANTLAVLQRMLFSGITSVRDMAGDARTLAGLSRDALVGDMISPDIYYSALMAGPAFFKDPRTIISSRGGVSGGMPYLKAVTDSTNLVLAIAEAKGTGATGIKLYADLSAELANKIAIEANKQNIYVWAHAWLQGAKPSDLVKAGVNPISHSLLLIYEKFKRPFQDVRSRYNQLKSIADSLPDLSSLFQLMKEKNAILDATMIAYKKVSKEDTSRNYLYEITKRITASAYKAGVMIDAGTDDDQEGFVQGEMELLVKDAGFSPIDAIIAATLNGAKALRLDKTRGAVSKGKIADLVLLNKNPLENIQNIKSVYLVIKGGKLFRK